MKIKEISSRTLERVESGIIVAMLLLCFYWGVFNISRATAILSLLLFGSQQLINRILKKRNEAAKREKVKLKLQAAKNGNVYYPRAFNGENSNCR